MSANKKKAIQTVFKYSKTTFLWGFIPFVVYLGNYHYKILILFTILFFTKYNVKNIQGPVKMCLLWIPFIMQPKVKYRLYSKRFQFFSYQS